MSGFQSTEFVLLMDMPLIGVKRFLLEKNKEYSTLDLCNQ